MIHILPPLIVILGPTASGKSGLAVQLAKKFGGFIISADSRQVYRGMDIGTAKPSKSEQAAVAHFLIDVVDPNEAFTVADYQRQVFDVLGKEPGLPFLVGGTGLYIASILEHWKIPKGSMDDAERTKLQKTSLHLLIKKLQTIDPASTAVINLKNKRRVIRALEVAEQTGASFVQQKEKRPLPYRVLQIGLSVPRPKLVKRIDQRVDDMMRHGLLKETEQLAEKYGWDAPSMSSIGYRQLGQHLRGDMSLDQAVERIKIETRQYAKRQMTWFKRDNTIHWVRTTHEAKQLIASFLQEGSE